MSARSAVAVLLSILAACGDRDIDRIPRTDPLPRIADGARRGAASLSPPLADLVPTAFVSACMAGDPVAGDPWALGEVDAALTPLTLETIEALSSRDSARLAARVARAVDVLPSDTTLADFRGLPVVVRAAWRVIPASGDTVVAALVARRLPMESNPLEELYFLVAAPGQRQGVREPLVEAWVVREAAPEETIAVRELVAAFAIADTILLVLARETDDGVRTELLSRRGGVWRLDWTGPLPSCAP